jgi:2-polyprenyl-3-methyl-5-hydroxy-6-metoxy-1,4-benzoquinol methylase
LRLTLTSRGRKPCHRTTSKGCQLLSDYRSKLIDEGRSTADADRIIEEILRAQKSDPARARALETLFYNKSYLATKPNFDEAPNKLLVEVASQLSPGKALDVAMGKGRNALFLATRGWQVTGFDLAESGLERAMDKPESLEFH